MRRFFLTACELAGDLRKRTITSARLSSLAIRCVICEAARLAKTNCNHGLSLPCLARRIQSAPPWNR